MSTAVSIPVSPSDGRARFPARIVAARADSLRKPAAGRALVDREWDALLICAAGYVMTAVGRIHQLFSALEIIHLAMLVSASAILLYVLNPRTERRIGTMRVATTTLAALLLFWSTLSIPSALVVGTSFDLVFDNFAKTLLMSFVVAAAVRGARDVERLAFVYFASAVIYSAIVMSRFDLGDGGNWRLGHLYYYDANDFATFVVTAVPFGVHFLHTATSGRMRASAAIGLVVLSLGFVWSGSRGGFIALGAVVFYVVARYRTIALRWRLCATAIVAAVVLATASDHYWEQMGTITSEDDYNHTSETGRLQIWSRGIGYMTANPLLGVGPGNFPAAEGRLSAHAGRQQQGFGVRWNAAHNSFVQIGAELGVPGLLLFVAVIASAFAALRRAESPLTPALTASLLGFVVGAFFLSLAYSEMLYTLIALAVGLRRVTDAAAA
jgi:O-antigen ligase